MPGNFNTAPSIVNVSEYNLNYFKILVKYRFIARSAALNSLDETFVCPYGQSGLYPHPFDCRKYLKCLNGQLSVETCRQGEVFSLSSKHCDPKELVGVKEQVPAQFDVGQISTSESSYGYCE